MTDAKHDSTSHPDPLGRGKQTSSTGMLVGAVVAAAVALGAAVVAVVELRGQSQPLAAPASTTQVVVPSTAAATTTSSATTTTVADPETSLDQLGAAFSSRYITRIAEDECGGRYAMIEVNGAPRLYRWTGTDWEDDSDRLDLGQWAAASPVEELRAADVTMDGTYEFLVRFGANESVPHSYGGIFGVLGCQWRWIPINDSDEPSKFIDGLTIDEYGALVGTGYAGSSGRKSVYLRYEDWNDEFSTFSDEVDEYVPVPTVTAPPATSPKPYVVSTYCEVRSLLTSDMQGALWSVTVWNQWSNGDRTSASVRSFWSWFQPSC